MRFSKIVLTPRELNMITFLPAFSLKYTQRVLMGSLSLLLSFALPVPAQSQALSGMITGSVSSEATGTYLEGTVVTIDELSLRTLTRRDGSFEFRDIRPGSYQVQAFYTGLPMQSQTVSVTAGETAAVEITFKQREVLQLEAMYITGTRAGDAASITSQRNAANVITVTAMDAFGSVADGNVGNFMVRLPGVTGNFENGEVTTISIRGTPAEFSSVTVDGARAASALAGFNPSGDRAPQINQIPAEFIKEVEVIKALLPENSADSIGGTANLKTKSAFDFGANTLFYRAGVNHNMHRSDQPTFTPNFALTYLTRRGKDGNLGITTSLSYTDTISPRDRVDMQRLEADGRNTQARTLAQVNQRVRIGAGLRLDYKFDETLSTFVKLNYNYFDVSKPRTALRALVTGARRVADYNVVSRAAIEAGATPLTTSRQTAGVAPGYDETFTELLNSTWSHEARNAQVDARQFVAEVGGEKKLPAEQQLNFQATYNPSVSTTFDPFFTATLGQGIGMNVDTRRGLENPVFVQTYGPSVASGSDFSRYTATYRELSERAEDRMLSANLNYTKETRLSRFPLTLKSGLAWRQQTRRDDGTRSDSPGNTWQFVGADGVAGRNPLTGINDDNIAQFRSAQAGYDAEVQGTNPWGFAVDALDVVAVGRALQTNPEWFRRTGTRRTDLNKIDESVYAGYAQGSLTVDKLGVVGGVRYERTVDDAVGAISDPRSTATRFERKANYDHLFPSVHFRYEFTPALTARASFSTGMSRPNVNDLYPATTVNYTAETVSQNNTALDPQYTENVDLALEYYFEPAGVFSVGVFRKDITGFLATTTTPIETGSDNGFSGNYAGFDLITKSNLGAAKVEGFEINYRQTLAMLPAPFNGLGLFGNYTQLRTNGTYNGGVSELAGFVPEFGNAGVSYRWRGLEARLAATYAGEYLSTYSTDQNAKMRVKALTTIDVSLAYTIRPELSIFLDVVNLEDKWPVTFSGSDSNRVRIVDSYGTRLNIGINGRF
jgi:TonB-dependent receptor